MKLIWGEVRKIGRMYGIAWRGWVVGVYRPYDPGVIYEWRGGGV